MLWILKYSSEAYKKFVTVIIHVYLEVHIQNGKYSNDNDTYAYTAYYPGKERGSFCYDLIYYFYLSEDKIIVFYNLLIYTHQNN